MGAGVMNKRSGGRKGGTYKPMAEINVTPFVDVMLVLLIVFMVAAPLLTTGVPIDLPDSEAKAITEEDNKSIEIFMERDGTITYGETKIKNKERLIAQLKAITRQDSDRRIYLRADKNIDYGQVMALLGSINAAGFQKVALITDPAP